MMSRSATIHKPTGFGAIWFNIVESAAKYGHLDAAKLLIENGTDVNQRFTQFHWNIDDDYYKLLDLEGKRNLPYVESALGIAAGMSHVAIAELLPKNGEDPNIKPIWVGLS